MTTLSRDNTGLREVRTELGVLRYREAGDPGCPPLILLHGSGPGVSGWANFGGVLPAFAEFFHCFVLEFPGFGISDDVDGHPMASAQNATRVFMDALDLDSVSLLGNSMGGIVAANLAISQPRRVRELVTIGGLGTPIVSPSPGEGIRLLTEFADNPSRERLVRWLRSMVYDPATVTDELIEDRWQRAGNSDSLGSLRRMYGSAAMAAARATGEADTAPYWAELHRIQAPTLLTWGRDDRVSTPDMAWLPLRTIPDAQLHVFPECGHWVMSEQKEAFESVVLSFLLRN